ncbi:MarR family transcriptional regulator [Paenibacillus sp. LMG 31456]|uniref:MarR family transcriptional regulator n=1 Tax=Paenibacillus foliorum TaxID=2654974 RepID=A0A972GM40_9BACL|nr:MarR family transcriptional regulator [Paenibacillus foliorum]NOU93311.1 MarR family transcriptional regulator [Paenibacillus foliorum]
MNVTHSIGFIISNTGRKLSQHLTIRFQPYDITSEQWSVLSKLSEQDGISQRELSHRTEKDPTNVTRILDQLERKGWIRRVPNPEDRRSFLTYVTDSGRELNIILAPIEAQLIQEILTSLSEDEITLLRKIFTQINSNLLSH